MFDAPEAYRFEWVGKRDARIEAYRRIEKTLRPNIEESLEFEATRNLYIEGDNLDVLKLLQQSYEGKVKLIYIDPPYNTGHDFIYKDRFEMDEEEFAERVQLYDEDRNIMFEENTESNPRFHSDWCNMIYSRLLLARNLLSDDGAIFISIDDGEQGNLRKICDEVFGERNFICNVIWEKKFSPQNNSQWLSDNHDFILVYAKNKLIWRPNLLPRTEEMDARYKNPDNDPRGAWTSGDLLAPKMNRSYIYEIATSSGEKILPPDNASWRVSKEKFDELIQDNRVWFGENGNNVPRLKRFLSEVKSGSVSKTIWIRDEVGDNQEAAREFKSFNIDQFFDTPKPTRLIRKILQLASDPDSIILDFFSGSATTAHAVMQLNAEDGGSRRFIMVQLPEICKNESETIKTICDIGRERIRRAGSKIEGDIDRGFRVLKLDSTNFRDTKIKPSELTREKILDLAENIKPDRSSLDLLFGCLIDWGIELDLSLEIEEHDGATILDYGDGDLLACFDLNLKRSVIEYMAQKKPRRVVFRDGSFSRDADKINAESIFKLYSPSTRFKVI